jgi:hypothetical protein
MTNEAILVQQLEERFFEATIANGSAGSTILKGSIMKWDSDPNTVAVSSADGDLFAGILLADKVNGDGVTRVALGRRGVYAMKITAGGTTVLGEPVKIAGANQIALADDATAQKTSEMVGISLETGGNAEVIQVLCGFI